MAAWVTIIGAFIQLITMILQNKFNKDAEEKQRKADLHARLKDAIKAGDTDRINDIFVSLRT